MQSETIARQVRGFIVENFLLGQDTGLTGSDSFLEGGIIDSTGVLQLVAFLEENYGIRVEDEEVIPENMDSLDNVSAFLCRKLNITASASVQGVQESLSGGKA